VCMVKRVPKRPFDISEMSWDRLAPIIRRRLRDGERGLKAARENGDIEVVADGVRALQSTDEIGLPAETRRVMEAHDEMMTYLRESGYW